MADLDSCTHWTVLILVLVLSSRKVIGIILEHLNKRSARILSLRPDPNQR
jgi:hypothetical protein